MARKKKTNKNLVIILLVVLLLALAVGYAAFSETLTITGTANAGGTFDLEFQEAKVVKAVGVNTENTKAVISVDKNTLTVAVDGLSYPGAGAEFTTDIVNVGSIPATVKAVTLFDLEGSDALKSAIKIKGLDVISSNHPTLEAGEKCNIHFTVEWDKDSQVELGEEDGTLTFGLAIEYTQKTDETFSGQPSHSDGTNSTNTTGGTENTNTVTPPVTDPETPPAVETEVKLADLATLTTSDIGKTIDYSVTVNGVTINEWRVFSVDEKIVKIITTGYIPHTAIPEAAKNAGLELSEESTYNVFSKESRNKLLSGLLNGWDEYVTAVPGVEGITAKGTPTNEEFSVSWNSNPAVNSVEYYENYAGQKIEDPTKLYLPYNEIEDGSYGYWLASLSETITIGVWRIHCNGDSDCRYYNSDMYGIRPVVTIPKS